MSIFAHSQLTASHDQDKLERMLFFHTASIGKASVHETLGLFRFSAMKGVETEKRMRAHGT